MFEVWHWILDFMGVNNTYNDFSTHMYNFWSGFGGGLIQFSLFGLLIWLYRHNVERLKRLDSLIRKPIEKIETRIEENHDK
jgi:hypothetical protein